jgi:dolichol-phosphate mannosyltransferase
VASRDAAGGGTSDWSLLRVLISRSLRALGKLLLPGALSRVSDPMTGFFIVRRSSIENLELNPCGYKILVELLARARIGQIEEVGYVFHSRQHGKSKASPKIFLEYVQHLLRLRATSGKM